jgi:shikimate dehydrogenase
MDRVHTLADLDGWRFDGIALAVLGHPVAHSISPAMHNAALAEMASTDARFARWRYFKFDLDPADLSAALPRFLRAGFLGLNLTIPHKVVAVDLVSTLDPVAAEAGAVNTLRRSGDGFEGFNTDGHGLVRAIAGDLGASIAGNPVVLLGAGGAARAAAVACLREGCRSLHIGNRTASTLRTLLEVIAPVVRRTGISVAGFDLANPSQADLPPDALVVNATSAGLKPGDPPPIDLSTLCGLPRVYDMIYNPWETPLLQAARARGWPAANGLSMLVHQGARSLEIWSDPGTTVPAATMHAACLAALGRAP